MDNPNSNNFEKLLTLNEAAQELGTTIEALIEWNRLNILKPTITLSGEVGYTEEQIDKFRAIQKVNFSLEKTTKTEIDKNISLNINPGKEAFPSTAATAVMGPADEAINLKPEATGAMRQNSHKINLSKYAYSSFLILISLLVLVLAQQGKLNFLLNYLNFQKESGVKTASTSGINEANLASSGALASQAKEDNLSEKKIENTEKNALRRAFDANSSKEIATNAASSKIAREDLTDDKVASVAGADSVGYAARGSLITDADSVDSAFDTQGNIKGETGKSDILAINTEAVAEVLKDSSLKNGSNFSAIYVLFGLVLASFIFLLRKQVFAPVKAIPAPSSPSEEKVVMKVNQKTDGTVVLDFQGQEYKICKPDMDSESDQFIERLMGLTASSTQEFDYDMIGDSQVNFNAPLSKLVTRLGFVGLKRNLFFPRTSKSSVLFRRCITENDLNSMNVSADQVIKEFSAIN